MYKYILYLRFLSITCVMRKVLSNKMSVTTNTLFRVHDDVWWMPDMMNTIRSSASGLKLLLKVLSNPFPSEEVSFTPCALWLITSSELYFLQKTNWLEHQGGEITAVQIEKKLKTAVVSWRALSLWERARSNHKQRRQKFKQQIWLVNFVNSELWVPILICCCCWTK